MSSRRHALSILLSALAAPVLPGCALVRQPTRGGTDGWCTVNGARLHVVAWGGQGPPLILLAGLNNTAYIFDELAPRLASMRQVYAFTRRGFGDSERTQSGYDMLALAADVVGLMDALHIERADIVGHSIAGGEMTMVAARYPERVGRLIYLDAAYDRSEVASFGGSDPAEPRSPPAAALREFERLIEWKHRAMSLSSPALDADLRATYIAGPLGTLEPRTPVAVSRQVAMGDRASPPDYRSIRASALALYVPKDRAEQVPPEATDERRQASIEFSLEHVRPWMLRERARFESEIACGWAAEVPHAGHYFFLEQPQATANVIAAFLKAPNPCAACGVIEAWVAGLLPVR